MRPISLAVVAALAAVSANAQSCFTATGTSIAGTLTPTGTFPVDDEGIGPETPFNGFTFPLGGTNWTHYAVHSNGEIYLTDGSGVVDPIDFGINILDELRGAVGASPRIGAYMADLQSAGANWDILVDDTVSNEVKVSWVSVAHFGGTGDMSFSVTLSAGGVAILTYADGSGFGATPFGSPLAGISAGNAVGTGSEPSLDLNGGADSGSIELLFQGDFDTMPWDLDTHSILVIANGLGGLVANVVCGLAKHTSLGSGCYDVAGESFYQLFTDAAVASATLTGNAITVTPNGGGYDVTWIPTGGNLYVAPTAAATQLAVGNDDEVTYTPAVPFPTSKGPVADFTVNGNGVIAFGAVSTELGTENWIPDPALMLASSHGGVFCWHAYNEDEGGDVWAEEVGGVTYITFQDVENFPLGTLNPSTWQVQFDHATGNIFMVFVDIDDDNSSIFGIWPQDHLIGFTPPGASLDPGAVDLATQLPITITPDINAISIRATPRPVSTGSMGTLVTYTVEDAPEFLPGSNTAVGILVLSVSGGLPGVDLGFLGAPGCSAYVGGIDVPVSFVGPLGPQSLNVPLPPGILSGSKLYAQAAALSDGINAFGVVTSNGLESLIADN